MYTNCLCWCYFNSSRRDCRDKRSAVMVIYTILFFLLFARILQNALCVADFCATWLKYNKSIMFRPIHKSNVVFFVGGKILWLPTERVFLHSFAPELIAHSILHTLCTHAVDVTLEWININGIQDTLEHRNILMSVQNSEKFRFPKDNSQRRSYLHPLS